MHFMMACGWQNVNIIHSSVQSGRTLVLVFRSTSLFEFFIGQLLVFSVEEGSVYVCEGSGED